MKYGVKNISPQIKQSKGVVCLLVGKEGFEPSRYHYQGIFLLLYVAIATFMCCSLEHVFTIFLSELRWLVYVLYTFTVYSTDLARR